MVYIALLYERETCETWTVGKTLTKRLDVFDTWCPQNILCIPYTRHNTNDTVRSITACSPVSGWVKSLRLSFFGRLARSASYSSLTSVDVAGSTISLADHIKVLGVMLDKHLTFDDHVNSVSKSAFYHIRAMRHIRPAHLRTWRKPSPVLSSERGLITPTLFWSA